MLQPLTQLGTDVRGPALAGAAPLSRVAAQAR